MKNMKFIKLLFMSMIFPLVIIGQEEIRDQSIELPDFVITGVERVSIPAAEKPKAELIPTLSEEFFKPSFSPEELEIAELSNPIKKDIQLFNYSKEFEGKVDVAVGVHTLPVGELSYQKNFNSFVFGGNVWGKNEIPDTSFASRNYSGFDIGGHYFVNENTKFFGGTKFEFSGGYSRESYKFMASLDPMKKRNTHYGNFNFGMSNLMNENFKFSLLLNDKITDVRDLDIVENNFKGKFYTEFGFADYSITGLLNYENLSGENLIRQNFFEASGYFNLNLKKNMKLGIGLYSASTEDENFFMPAANFGLRFSKYLSFYSELKPNAQFYSIDELIENNRYFTGNKTNIFTKNKLNLSAAVKYEYETYFELNGGIKFGNYDNYPFYLDEIGNGVFDINTIDAVEFAGFVNFIFRPGPFGNFYANAELRNLENEDENFIPYVPFFNADLLYGYKFPFGLGFTTGINYISKRYTDLANTNEISDFIDLTAKIDFDINSYFNIYVKAENILDKENPYWLGYQNKLYNGKPFDIMAGLNYRW